MKRLKLYYPKSSILENLHTNGSEYMLDTGKSYIGLYHKYDTGEAFTGPTWEPYTSLKLYPLLEVSSDPRLKGANSSKIQAFANSDNNIKKYGNPISEMKIPTQSDFVTGYYYRYFCQKRNEKSNIYEISSAAYSSYGTPGGINEFLYMRGRIKWILTGDEFDVYDRNGSFVRYGVINQNRREVLALQRLFPYIQMIFGDFRQFTQYSRTGLNQPMPLLIKYP